MKEKTKKILTIIIFIIVTIILAFCIWFLFFRQEGESIVPGFISGIGERINNKTGEGEDKKGKDTGKTITIDPDDDQGDEGTEKDITPDDIAEIINNDNDNKQNIVDVIKRSENVGPVSNNIDPVEKISDIASGGSTSSKIVSINTSSKAVVSGNSIISYNPKDGGIYKFNPETKKTERVVDKSFKGAKDVIFSNNAEKAVIEFPDGSNVVYDFKKDKQYVLPSSWYDFSFQKDGDKLAFLIDSNDYNKRWLAVADPDGSNIAGVEPLGNNFDKVTVSYSPNEQMIAFSRTGKAIGGLNQSVLLIGLNGENFDDIKVYGRGFHPKWSPKGTYVVYDAYNESTKYNPNLWLVSVSSSAVGTKYLNLGLQTWVDKCTFDLNESFLYCAVPKKTLPDGTGIFRDQIDGYGYYDNIYKVNIKTGYSQLLAIPASDVTIEKIYITDDSSLLYYIDKNTGVMYSMRLK